MREMTSIFNVLAMLMIFSLWVLSCFQPMMLFCVRSHSSWSFEGQQGSINLYLNVKIDRQSGGGGGHILESQGWQCLQPISCVKVQQSLEAAALG